MANLGTASGVTATISPTDPHSVAPVPLLTLTLGTGTGAPLGNILIYSATTTSTSPRVLRAFALSALILGGASSTPGSWARAAPAPNLTFDISARVTLSGAAMGAGDAGQKFSARVLLHGNRTRIESTYANQKSVTLIAPPYIYRFLPASKAGVRWKMDGSRANNFAALGLDPQELVRNPGKIRALLLTNGAKRAGSSTLNGASVDVYAIDKPGEQLSNARAYLRKSDGLPLKLDASGKGLKVSALWSNYARPKNLSADLFRAPKGYKIREAKTAPPTAMF